MAILEHEELGVLSAGKYAGAMLDGLNSRDLHEVLRMYARCPSVVYPCRQILTARRRARMRKSDPRKRQAALAARS